MEEVWGGWRRWGGERREYPWGAGRTRKRGFETKQSILGWLGRGRLFSQSRFAVLAAAELVADRSPRSCLSRKKEAGGICKNQSLLQDRFRHPQLQMQQLATFPVSLGGCSEAHSVGALLLLVSQLDESNVVCSCVHWGCGPSFQLQLLTSD